MEYIISLDLGTTAIKVAIIDTEGRLVSKSTQEYTLLTPDVLSVELEVETYWSAFKAGVSEVLLKTGIKSEQIKALGISAQGETLILTDGNGKPLRNAIVWMDNRAHKEADRLSADFPKEVSYKITGQVSIVPTWPASKILWLRENEPSVFRNTEKFLLIEDYFIHRLTGVFAAEGSLLTSTVYWDMNTRKWWKDMLKYLNVDEGQLPEIHESGDLIGSIRPDIARELGLSPETLVCAGALDQAAGAIGVGNIRPGVFSENTGAALAICATTDRPVLDPTYRMPCHYHAIPGIYMEHTFTTGGMVLKWFRDNFCSAEIETGLRSGMDSYNLLGLEAESVSPGADGLVMLPHLQGAMAPEDNPKAKGVFYGITLRHTRPHFIRAIMESIGYLVRRNIDVIEDLGIEVNEIRGLGGGARSAVWNQIKADITGKPVLTMANDEAACLGAAIVAGVGTGMFRDLDSACARMVKVHSRFEPRDDFKKIYLDGYHQYIDLYDSLTGMFAGKK